MSGFTMKLSSLFEYFGFQSKSYYHSRPEIGFDPDDPLPYYLDQTQRASFKGQLDEAGLPLYQIGNKYERLPGQVIPFGLGHFEKHRRTGSEESLRCFQAVSDWLVADQQADGCWIAPTGPARFYLRGPFRSAMNQGLAISALVRAAQVFDSGNYLKAAVRGLQPFHKEIAADGGGGVTSYHPEGPFYEEYPCQPGRHVLNGFFFAMWGLKDLERMAGNQEAKLLWDNGLKTIIAWLPDYDLGYWSLYHLPPEPPNPATITYHDLHVLQLDVMHRLTGEAIFADYRDRWDAYRQQSLNRLRTLPTKIRWLLSTR